MFARSAPARWATAPLLLLAAVAVAAAPPAATTPTSAAPTVRIGLVDYLRCHNEVCLAVYNRRIDAWQKQLETLPDTLEGKQKRQEILDAYRRLRGMYRTEFDALFAKVLAEVCRSSNVQAALKGTIEKAWTAAGANIELVDLTAKVMEQLRKRYRLDAPTTQPTRQPATQPAPQADRPAPPVRKATERASAPAGKAEPASTVAMASAKRPTRP